VTVAPDVVAPPHDLAAFVEVGFDLDRHRRAAGRARQLVGARPLHANGPPAGCPGEERGVERHIVGAVVAIAARSFRMLDHDPFRRKR
jgi:hypothetical protein